MHSREPVVSAAVVPSAVVLAAALGLALLAGCAGSDSGPRPPDPAAAAAGESHLRDEVAQNPDEPALTFSLARTLAAQGKAEEALDYFRRTQTLDPDREQDVVEERQRFLEQYQNEALVMLESGRTGQADSALDRAEIMVPFDPRTTFLKGKVAAAGGDPEGALVYLRRAALADPGNETFRDALVEVLLSTAHGRYEAEDYTGAWDRLEEARTQSPQADIDYLRGLVAYAWSRNAGDPERFERLDSARESFERVLDRNPDDEDALFNLGAVLLSLERYPDAVGVYRDLLGRHPTDGGLYLALARAHSLSGESEAAVSEDAVGRALRSGEPVSDPATWALRAAERYPETDLDTVYADQGSPEDIYTYNVPGGSLVEVWFYWNAGFVYAFREGGRMGLPVFLPGRQRSPFRR
jgi:tetratricopeptide (TPR) repeat protein